MRNKTQCTPCWSTSLGTATAAVAGSCKTEHNMHMSDHLWLSVRLSTACPRLAAFVCQVFFSLPETARKKRILHKIPSIGARHRGRASTSGGSGRDVLLCVLCVGPVGRKGRTYKDLFEKLEGKSPLGRPRHMHQVF
jgi:hypothetical protein